MQDHATTFLATVNLKYMIHVRVVVSGKKNRQFSFSYVAYCNPEQVANLLHAQINSASYPQRDGK